MSTFSARLAVVLALSYSVATAQTASGVDVLRLIGPFSAGELRVDPQRHDFRIESSSNIAQLGSRPPTLDFIADVVPPQPKRYVLMGGASDRWNPYRPFGLLVVEQRVVSPLSDRTDSGVLCVSRRGEPRILSLAAYRQAVADCHWALQAMVYVPHRLASIGGQLIACQRPTGLAFYAFNAREADPQLVFGKEPCASALNLAGEAQAGMVSYGRERHGYGASGVAVAAVILVQQRGEPVALPLRTVR